MVATEVEDRILKIPGVKNTITMVGYSGENTALIVAELDDWSKRKSKDLSMQSILSKIKKEFAIILQPQLHLFHRLPFLV